MFLSENKLKFNFFYSDILELNFIIQPKFIIV